MPQELLTRGLPPPDPRSLCPLSSTEFVEPPPPEQNSWVRHWRVHPHAAFTVFVLFIQLINKFQVIYLNFHHWPHVTLWGRVFSWKAVSFSASYGTVSFITTLQQPTSNPGLCHTCQPTSSHPVLLRAVLILSSHLRLSLAFCLSPSDVHSKTLLSHGCNIPRPSRSWSDNGNDILWAVQTTNLGVTHSPALHCYLVPFRLVYRP